MMLDHVTIRTSRLEETLAFFVALFDLKEGPRPQAIQRIPGHWLYAAGQPIVHLIGGPPRAARAERAGNAIDHVAFRLDDIAAFRARLSQLGVRHSEMALEELGERRIFLTAPGGPLLEVVFREAATVESVA